MLVACILKQIYIILLLVVYNLTMIYKI